MIQLALSPKPARLAALSLALLLAGSAPAAPGWANKGDGSNGDGHSFVCEGEGKTEEDALAAAQGICNDKICKICGVEIESVTTTSESLKGIDLQRKVVERCRRVRKSETQVKRKSADCEDDKCSAWIEVFYSAADEKAECPAYTQESFADPALCEQDIDGFRNVKERTADSFRERTRLLELALRHCEKIDVRPTPAILALDNKLRAGMDAFEFTEQQQQRFVEENPVSDPWERGAETKREASLQDRPWWAWYLTSDPELRRAEAEAKLLTDRVRLIRDYVANRALVFDVLEAARARDLDTPAGIERLRAAMERAPPGGQYGSHDVHFNALTAFFHAKSDISPIGALMRKLYDPAKVEYGQLWETALFFKDDNQTTQEEWDWIFAGEKSRLCIECMRVLLEAKDHGSMEKRLARFDAAYALAAPQLKGKNPEVRAFTELVGHNDAGLLVGALARAPKTVPPQLGWDYLSSAVYALDPKRNTPEEGEALLARVVSLQAQAMEAGAGDAKQHDRDCTSLADHLKRLEDKGADTAPLADAACACLTGPLRDEVHLVNRDDLYRWAEKRKPGCVRDVPPPPR